MVTYFAVAGAKGVSMTKEERKTYNAKWWNRNKEKQNKGRRQKYKEDYQWRTEERARKDKYKKPGRLRLRFQVFTRDNFTCRYCGRIPPQVSLQVDHVIPYSKGGATELGNLVTACSECNMGKSDILIDKK